MVRQTYRAISFFFDRKVQKTLHLRFYKKIIPDDEKKKLMLNNDAF